MSSTHVEGIGPWSVRLLAAGVLAGLVGCGAALTERPAAMRAIATSESDETVEGEPDFRAAFPCPQAPVQSPDESEPTPAVELAEDVETLPAPREVELPASAAQ